MIRIEHERTDTSEVLVCTMEDKRKLHVEHDRLKEKLEITEGLRVVQGYLLGRAEEKVKELKANCKNNTANITMLTRAAVYLKDKVRMLQKMWVDADSIRVDKLQELNSQLPPEF